MASLQAAILDESRVAQAHVRPGAHSIGTAVGAVRKAFELVGLVQHVTPVAAARVRSGTVPVQAGPVAGWFALVARRSHDVARLAGARFRCGTDAVEAAIGANRFTSLVGSLVTRSALTDPRSNAVSSTATTFTFGNAQSVFIRGVTFVTNAPIDRHTSSNSTTSLTSGNAELATLVQFVTLFADALSQVQVANAVVTTDGTSRDTFPFQILHKVRIAAASVRTDTQPVEAGLFTDRITLPEVVHVPFEALAADLNATQRRIGTVTSWKKSAVWLDQADRGNFLKADPGWDGGFGLVHELI